MIDIVLDFLSENFGVAVVILIFIIVAFVYLIWWTAKMWYKFKNLPCGSHANQLEKYSEVVNSVSHLPCSRIEQEVGNHDERIRAIENALSRIEGLIQGLYRLPIKMQENDFSCDVDIMSQKHSPRALNQNGLKLFKEIRGQQFLEENKSIFFSTIDYLAPKTALDVEMFSFSALRIKSNEACFNAIKNWVYNAPAQEIIDENGVTRKKDISFETVLFVLSIPLRDMYLSEHPEIIQS